MVSGGNVLGLIVIMLLLTMPILLVFGPLLLWQIYSFWRQSPPLSGNLVYVLGLVDVVANYSWMKYVLSH